MIERHIGLPPLVSSKWPFHEYYELNEATVQHRLTLSQKPTKTVMKAAEKFICRGVENETDLQYHLHNRFSIHVKKLMRKSNKVHD